MSFSDDESNLSLLEQELQTLRPMQPSPDFMLRLNRRMSQPAGRATAPAATPPMAEENLAPVVSFSAPKAKSWRKIAPWAAAAAVAAASTHFMKSPALPEPGANTLAENRHEKLKKVRAERRVQEAREENVVLDPQRGAMRSIRFQYSNNYEVEDMEGQKMGFQFPSEERMLIPVKVY